MRNVYCFFALIALLALSSCEKELVEMQYITPADAQLTEVELAQLDYQMADLDECIKADWDEFWEDKGKEVGYTAVGNSGECEDDKDTDGCMFADYDKEEEEGLKKHVIKPIVKSDECGCIVSGLIKYVENDRTTALVDYGDGTCDAWVVKVSFDKAGNKETTFTCKYEMECDKE